MRKQLISAIIQIVVVAVFVSAAIAITTNAVVTNQVAINQLNGGDDAYLMQELYYKYKNVVELLGGLVIGLSAIPLVKIICNHFKNK